MANTTSFGAFGNKQNTGSTPFTSAFTTGANTPAFTAFGAKPNTNQTGFQPSSTPGGASTGGFKPFVANAAGQSQAFSTGGGSTGGFKPFGSGGGQAATQFGAKPAFAGTAQGSNPTTQNAFASGGQSSNQPQNAGQQA